MSKFLSSKAFRVLYLFSILVSLISVPAVVIFNTYINTVGETATSGIYTNTWLDILYVFMFIGMFYYCTYHTVKTFIHGYLVLRLQSTFNNCTPAGFENGGKTKSLRYKQPCLAALSTPVPNAQVKVPTRIESEISDIESLCPNTVPGTIFIMFMLIYTAITIAMGFSDYANNVIIVLSITGGLLPIAMVFLSLMIGLYTLTPYNTKLTVNKLSNVYDTRDDYIPILPTMNVPKH